MNHKTYSILYYEKHEKTVHCPTIEIAENKALNLMKELRDPEDPVFEPSYQLHSIVEVEDEVPLPV